MPDFVRVFWFTNWALMVHIVVAQVEIPPPPPKQEQNTSETCIFLQGICWGTFVVFIFVFLF